MSSSESMRELTATEIESVSGGVHLGGILDRIAQYLWNMAR